MEHSSLADCGDWNRTLAQTLIPDFQPLKETALLSNGSPYQPHRPQVHSNGSVNGGPPSHQTNQPTQPQLTSGRIPQPPPDIQSSHFTISPIKHELVHVDLLEGTDFKRSTNTSCDLNNDAQPSRFHIFVDYFLFSNRHN